MTTEEQEKLDTLNKKDADEEEEVKKAFKEK